MVGSRTPNGECTDVTHQQGSYLPLLYQDSLCIYVCNSSQIPPGVFVLCRQQQLSMS